MEQKYQKLSSYEVEKGIKLWLSSLFLPFTLQNKSKGKGKNRKPGNDWALAQWYLHALGCIGI